MATRSILPHGHKPKSAAVYARISLDDEQEGAGVKRQQEDTLAEAKRLGWEVGSIYIDNDRSAFRKKGQRPNRPEWDRLLDDLATGLRDGLLVYNLDRVAREPRDSEDLIEKVEDRRVPTRAVTGMLDLSNDAGVTNARMMVTFANLESRNIGRRVARKHLELAKAGKVGGGVRPFGFEDDRVTHKPEEAEALRDAAKRVLAGPTPSKSSLEFSNSFQPSDGDNCRAGWWRHAPQHAASSPYLLGVAARELSSAFSPAGQRSILAANQPRNAEPVTATLHPASTRPSQ